MCQSIRPSDQNGVEIVGQNAVQPPGAMYGKRASGHHFWSPLLVTNFGHYFGSFWEAILWSPLRET